MAKPFLSIVIPTCDDAEHLPLTLIEADRIFSAESFAYEIIVVDDGSQDGTSESAKRVSEYLKNIKVIDNTERRGIGTAARIGLMAAKGVWRVVIIQPSDAPFSWVAEKLETIQPSSNVHVLTLEGKVPRMSRLADAVRALFMRAVFRSRIRVFSPLALCFSQESAARISSLLVAHHAMPLEALLLAERLGYRTIETTLDVPTPRTSQKASYLQTLTETFKIRWWLWREKYQIENTNI